MSKRTDAREVAFKLVFEYLFTKEQNNLLLAELSDSYNLQEEQQYAYKVYNGVVSNLDNLQQQIAQTAIGFSADRIYRVDEAILLVSLYEILYMQDIPYAVSVNEAVELAKKFSTTKSTSFINGILSKFKK